MDRLADRERFRRAGQRLRRITVPELHAVARVQLLTATPSALTANHWRIKKPSPGLRCELVHVRLA